MISEKDFIEILENFHNVHHLDLFRNRLVGFDEEKKKESVDVTQSDDPESEKVKYKLDREKQYKIQGIDFRSWIDLNLSRFNVMIQILAQNESLKKSLQYIWVDGWKFSTSKAQILLVQNGIFVTLDGTRIE